MLVLVGAVNAHGELLGRCVGAVGHAALVPLHCCATHGLGVTPHTKLAGWNAPLVTLQQPPVRHCVGDKEKGEGWGIWALLLLATHKNWPPLCAPLNHTLLANPNPKHTCTNVVVVLPLLLLAALVALAVAVVVKLPLVVARAVTMMLAPPGPDTSPSAHVRLVGGTPVALQCGGTLTNSSPCGSLAVTTTLSAVVLAGTATLMV